MSRVLAPTVFASMILGGDSRLGAGFKSPGLPLYPQPRVLSTAPGGLAIFNRQCLAGWSEVR